MYAALVRYVITCSGVLFTTVFFVYAQNAPHKKPAAAQSNQSPASKKTAVLPPPPAGLKKPISVPPVSNKKPPQPAVVKPAVASPPVAVLKPPQPQVTQIAMKPAMPAIPVLQAPVSLAPIDAKLKEVRARSTLLDKIMGLHDLCAMVTPTTSLEEKNNIITFCKELVASQMSMHKKELDALLSLCRMMLKQEGLLDSIQKTVMTQWIAGLESADQFVDDKTDLLTALKTNIGLPKKNYLLALKSANYAFQVFGVASLSPTELNAQVQDSLLSLLKHNLPLYFNNRLCSDPTIIKLLQAIVQCASHDQRFVGVVGAQWVPTLQLDNILSTAYASQNPLEAISLWNQFAKIITAATSTYEKQFFCDSLTTFFSNRKDRAVKELVEFCALLTMLSSVDFKQKKVFEPAQFTRFEEWKTILAATQVLINIKYTLPLQQNIASLSKILINITSLNASIEKDLLVAILSHYFDARGDMQHQNIDALKLFFQTVRKTPQILAANQLVVLDAWIAELDRAENATTGTQTYLASLIAQSLSTKSIDQLIFALTLFTPQTAAAVKTALVDTLNTFMTPKVLKQLDKNKLKTLLFSLEKQKVGGSSLLTDAQRHVLIQWLHMLG